MTGQIATDVTVAMVAGTGTATCYLTPPSIAQDYDAAFFWQGVSLNAVAAGDHVLAPMVTNGDVIRIKGLGRIVSGGNTG